MVKFAYTILYVQDVQKTNDFYQKAFGFTQKFKSPDNTYSELETGNTSLAFAAKTLALSNLKDGFIESSLQNQAFGIEIGFTTTDVAQTMHIAHQAGATIVEEPKTKPWGQTVGYVRDIDGFLIEICTPMAS